MTKTDLLREQSAFAAVIYGLVDVAMIYVGASVAYWWLYDTANVGAYYRGPVLVAVVLAIFIFPSLRLYDSWRGREVLDQIWRVSIAWVMAVAGMIVVAFALNEVESYSRIWVLTWAFVTWVLLITGRVTLHRVLLALRARGWNHRRIFIIGHEALVSDAIHGVKANPSTGWEVVAAAVLDQTDRQDKWGVPTTRYTHRIEQLVRRLKIDEIWLCLPLDRGDSMSGVLHDLRHHTKTIRLMPTLRSARLFSQPVTNILGFPMLNLRVAPIHGASRVVKAVEDRVLAAIILTLISPILFVLAVGVKLSSPGPVFFRQTRMGWNGKSFTILKFRSMPQNVEAQTGAVWAKAGETRSTAFGGFLRRTSLDELPQFINVIKGDMSIVGPRPERPVFVDQFKEEIPGYMQKHMVKAGITGWAQINGWRGSTDLTKRVEHDLYYIEHWSLWFDIKIIFLTMFKGFVHKNAY